MPLGEGKCRFSHKISKEQREDENLVLTQRKEKDEKASMCINEFRKKGDCWRKETCPYSHNITDEDRNNNISKKNMEEKVAVIRRKKEAGIASIGNQISRNDTPNQVDAFLKEVIAMKKEFLEVKEFMKTLRRP